jgi:hypothetical protein
VKVATVREFRDRATDFLRSDEVVLITRDGHPAGFWVPWDQPKSLPDDLRRAVFLRLAEQVRKHLDAAGVTVQSALEDFKASRRARR